MSETNSTSPTTTLSHARAPGAPRRARVAAPATVANVGPGFDIFGLALAAPMDVVEAWRVEEPGIHVEAIEGDDGRLPRESEKNTAAIAACETLKRIAGRTEVEGGVALRIEKGTPLASGMGSSAASAAGGARAVSELFPGVLTDEELLPACLAAEMAVSGAHADNVAPALLGGFVIVESIDPLRVHRIEPSFRLDLVVVCPEFEFPTAAARTALPLAVALTDAVANLGAATSMIHALHTGDLVLFTSAIRDRLAEPTRGGLIEGYALVRQAAETGGALAAGISGAGPSVFALARDFEHATRLGAQMTSAWRDQGIASHAHVTALANEGAHRVD